MLLVHQTGSVKVGEVVRYTLTYTPSSDRILPSPGHLYVKIKNTAAIPLRAAYLHGPYTLHVSTYPSTFDPNKKFETARRDGVPEFEPLLKAGGHWYSKLTVPEDIRESGEKVNSKRNLDGSPKTMTWVIEIASQILFSNTASVHYEFMVGRDERSLEVGFAAVAGKGHGEPGSVKDFKDRPQQQAGLHSVLPKGVYSRAVDLVVQDTAALWGKPEIPQWKDQGANNVDVKPGEDTGEKRTQRPKKLHLVILTHGLHGNVGADMLYLKESIDNAAKQAREHARKRKARGRKRESGKGCSTKPAELSDQKLAKSNLQGPADGVRDQGVQENEEEESDDEQVIVRGFAGNSVRTERGIQYLGKRLAKYVLTTTYPDQPFLPTSKSMSRSLTGNLSNSQRNSTIYGDATHAGEGILKHAPSGEKLPYTFTSISFIGHSLGGLVQTYAIAYIHKHAPDFFKQIKPVNFISMASPLLGLSNENPLYVKFALDFGLVGRTGQDLGLTWRAPTIARSGWSAMISGFGSGGGTDQSTQEDPRSKPLLRILPTGPAHQVLKMFRNRTVYSNVVNDGIVPLRTSCLLFLDWRGLDRVENARRDNGLIGTVAAFGWAELTGANTKSHRPQHVRDQDNDLHDSGDDRRSKKNQLGNSAGVPQPHPDATKEDDQDQRHNVKAAQFGANDEEHQNRGSDEQGSSKTSSGLGDSLNDFLNIFKPAGAKPQPTKSQKVASKTTKALKRAQTVKADDGSASDSSSPDHHKAQQKRPGATRGDSMIQDPSGAPPPKTSVFTAAGDLLNPPIPPMSWLLDPSTRDRTIFHDRIYHPEDIPPPPQMRRPKMSRSFSGTNSLRGKSQDISKGSQDKVPDVSAMRIEEKIARAYHRDLSWRKVLVRLEPDAHNNMVVRRMFANAYGWDVIKHLCDTHFGDNEVTLTRDSDETNEEQAKPMSESVSHDGKQVKDRISQERPKKSHRTFSETREETDEVGDLGALSSGLDQLASSSVPRSGQHKRYPLISEDSFVWNDDLLNSDDDGEDDSGEDETFDPVRAIQRFWNGNKKEQPENEPLHESQPQQQPDHRQHGSTDRSRKRGHKMETAGNFDMKPEVAETLTQLPGQDANLVEALPDADIQEPLRKPDTISASDEGTTDVERIISGTSEVGLQKPPQAHMADLPSPSSPHEGSTGERHVAERVLRISSSSGAM